jgi:phosphate transport system ATP-binding protein
MQQASRISDFTAFMYLGELVEFNNTKIIFNSASKQQTQEYVSGKFG